MVARVEGLSVEFNGMPQIFPRMITFDEKLGFVEEDVIDYVAELARKI